jgi:hypothetical protein
VETVCFKIGKIADVLKTEGLSLEELAARAGINVSDCQTAALGGLVSVETAKAIRSVLPAAAVWGLGEESLSPSWDYYDVGLFGPRPLEPSQWQDLIASLEVILPSRESETRQRDKVLDLLSRIAARVLHQEVYSFVLGVHRTLWRGEFDRLTANERHDFLLRLRSVSILDPDAATPSARPLPAPPPSARPLPAPPPIARAPPPISSDVSTGSPLPSERNGMPDELVGHLRSLTRWHDANKRDAAKDLVAYWLLKIPAIFSSAMAGVWAHFGMTTASVICGAISSFCIIVDALNPRGVLRNVHTRAVHDIAILSSRMVSRWNMRAPSAREFSFARTVIREFEDERVRIATYIRDAETALKSDIGK